MKTIDEAAYEESINAHGIENEKQYERGYTYNGFLAGVEFAQRWIPVGEELPEFDESKYPNGEYEEYLVKVRVGSMNPQTRYRTAHIRRDCRWSCEFDWNVVTHWRPIELK